MRRLIIEDHTSNAAVLSWHLALFAAAVACVGILAARRGLDPPSAVAVLASSAALACIAIICALLAFGVVWWTGDKGAGKALAGLVLAAVLLAYPAYLAAKAVSAPLIADISTDSDDPPAFSLSRRALAARDGVTPGARSATMRDAQVRAYPKILPILLDLDAPDAYAAVLAAIAAAGWKVVEKTPPGGRLGQAHIDAVAGSFPLNFPYDISVRIRPIAGQTRIDLRAVARFESYEFGQNPRNIERFEEALEAEVIPQEK